MIRGDAASGHKGHQSGSVAGLRYLGSTLLRDRAIINCNNCCHIVGCDAVQLQSVAGLLSGYERRRSASILFCQLCQIFTFVGFCQIFTQPQRSLNSSSIFSENLCVHKWGMSRFLRWECCYENCHQKALQHRNWACHSKRSYQE